MGVGLTYQPTQSSGRFTKSNAIGKRHFTQSVDNGHNALKASVIFAKMLGMDLLG